MDAPIDLNSRRERYDGQTCPCGSAWFDTRVTYAADGSITGHAITGVVCAECKQPMDPTGAN